MIFGSDHAWSRSCARTRDATCPTANAFKVKTDSQQSIPTVSLSRNFEQLSTTTRSAQIALETISSRQETQQKTNFIETPSY